MNDLSSSVVVLTLWVLIAFSLVTWTMVLMKGWLQWRLTHQNRAFSALFWKAPSLAEAEQAAGKSEGMLAQLCRAGFAALRDMQKNEARGLEHSGDRRDVLERVLRQEVQKQQNVLESGLMLLASIGSTAPFVGLFGTVWGIMHALEGISHSGSAGLDVVAGPIGEALIATALGIATAVPAVLAYNYGVRRAKLYVAELDNFATDFLHLALKSDFRVN